MDELNGLAIYDLDEWSLKSRILELVGMEPNDPGFISEVRDLDELVGNQLHTVRQRGNKNAMQITLHEGYLDEVLLVADDWAWSTNDGKTRREYAYWKIVWSSFKDHTDTQEKPLSLYEAILQLQAAQAEVRAAKTGKRLDKYVEKVLVSDR